MTLNKMRKGVKTPKNWTKLPLQKKLKVLDKLIALQNKE